VKKVEHSDNFLKFLNSKYWALVVGIWGLGIPFLLINWLGWSGRIFSIGVIFYGSLILAGFFFGLFPYGEWNPPKTESDRPRRIKIRIFFSFGRVVLLSIAVLGASYFFYLSKDVVLLIEKKPYFDEIRGTITDVRTTMGTAFFSQTITFVDGRGKEGEGWYIYSFATRYPTGSSYDFLILKNSRLIMDVK
jgi:hypothetical protein